MGRRTLAALAAAAMIPLLAACGEGEDPAQREAEEYCDRLAEDLPEEMLADRETCIDEYLAVRE